MSLTEISLGPDRFYTIDTNKPLGSGGYGDVFSGIRIIRVNDRYKEIPVAVKVIPLNTPEDEDSFHREVTAHQDLDDAWQCQEHIVCLLDTFVMPLNLYQQGQPIDYGVLVFDKMETDLENNPPQTSDDLIAAFLSILQGLAYIHSQTYSHLDLKPSNLLRKNDKVKIADFGVACSSNCLVGGTRRYLEPRLLRDLIDEPEERDVLTIEEAQASDIWSLGATLFELLFGFHIVNTWEQLLPMLQPDIDRIIWSAEPEWDTEDLDLDYMREFLNWILRVDSEERPNIYEILEEFEENL